MFTVASRSWRKLPTVHLGFVSAGAGRCGQERIRSDETRFHGHIRAWLHPG